MPTMAFAEFRVYFDGTVATDDQLDLVEDIRVDQAIGMATEAELTIVLTADDAGVWSSLDEDFAQPFSRVRVEVKIGDDSDEGDFVPLIDGPIVGQRFELGAGPGESALTLVIQDDSVLLNREETVAIYQDMTADEIVQQLYSDAGLTPQVDSVPDAGSALTRYVVQRGTAMQLVRELARSHGMFAYVKPGDTPGTSTGVFEQPVLTADDLPELLLMGNDRNIDSFSAQFDALRPLTAAAGNVSITDKTALSSSAVSSDLDSLGDEAVHDFLSPLSAAQLARTREEANDMDAATQAAVDLSSFAYSATAEVDAERFDTVLAPHQVISVAGAGSTLSGDYLISRVTHEINEDTYKQKFTLRRNARSVGTAGGSSLLGGIL
jgi:hypothetical protein